MSTTARSTLLRHAVVITAGGSGSRMGGGTPKQFLSLAGRPLLSHCVDQALEWAAMDAGDGLVVLVVSHPPAAADETAGLVDEAFALAGGAARFPHVQLRMVEGGSTRQASVLRALRVLPDDLAAVFVHDGVRPLASPALFHALWKALEDRPDALGVIPLLPSGDTIKRVAAATTGTCLVTGTLDREGVRAAQTPQLMRWPLLRDLHERAAAEGFAGTDDAALLEHFMPGRQLLGIAGETHNLKVTRPGDLELAEAWILGGTRDAPGTPARGRDEDPRDMTGLRVGQGFDVHAFAHGRRLVLGGVEIPFDRGLAGHSDADVLLHAIADALLGAAALDDIGAQFPDTEEAWKGADSWLLLRQVAEKVRGAGFVPINVDATLICELPRIRSHVPAMRVRIAAALDMPASAVNVKGTTTERLGFPGRGEGIAAQAVALLARERAPGQQN